MSWAFAQDVKPAAAKLCLLALANYCNEKNKCWPSKATIAKDCSADKSWVCRQLVTLRDAGLITVEERTQDGANLTSIITLNLNATPSGARATRPSGADATGGSGAEATRVVEPARHKPSLEPLIEPSLESPNPQRGPTPTDALVAFEKFNGTALRCGLPQAAKFTPDRKRKIIARLKDYGLDGWDQALANIERSSFLTGGGPRGWRADLDFLLQPASFSKVHDGGFGNGRHAAQSKPVVMQPKGPAVGSQEFLDEIERAVMEGANA